jgi:hypothetical protein
MNIKDVIYPTIKKKFDEISKGQRKYYSEYTKDWRFMDSNYEVKLQYNPVSNFLDVDIKYFNLYYFGIHESTIQKPTPIFSALGDVFEELLKNNLGDKYNDNKPLFITYLYRI